jgi:glutamate 5-kinase
MNKEIVIVSSGAVALGKTIITSENRHLCSAVGQRVLLENYSKCFSKNKKEISQLLITKKDFQGKEKRDHLKHIIEHSLEHGIITIINENDSLFGKSFNNNDLVSGEIAKIIGADLLVLITNTKGILDENNNTVEFAKSEKELEKFLRKDISENGTGGMKTKLDASKKYGGKTIICDAEMKEGTLIKRKSYNLFVQKNV